MTDIRIVGAINYFRRDELYPHDSYFIYIHKHSVLYTIASGQCLDLDTWDSVCTVGEYFKCVQEMSEGLFVPLSDYQKSKLIVPETPPSHADTQPLHAISVDLFNVGDTVYDLTGKPTTVQSDATIGKYTTGKLCGGSAQLYTTCFSSAGHFQRHEEASELADYISRKLEWGVVPEGVTLADLQTIKGIIDNGVDE